MVDSNEWMNLYIFYVFNYKENQLDNWQTHIYINLNFRTLLIVKYQICIHNYKLENIIHRCCFGKVKQEGTFDRIIFTQKWSLIKSELLKYTLFFRKYSPFPTDWVLYKYHTICYPKTYNNNSYFCSELNVYKEEFGSWLICHKTQVVSSRLLQPT